MNKLTTIAALPGSGAGCMATLPPEALTREDYLKAAKVMDENVAVGMETIKMRAPYFAEALKEGEAPSAAPGDGALTMATMEQIDRNLERMRAEGKA